MVRLPRPQEHRRAADQSRRSRCAPSIESSLISQHSASPWVPERLDGPEQRELTALSDTELGLLDVRIDAVDKLTPQMVVHVEETSAKRAKAGQPHPSTETIGASH